MIREISSGIIAANIIVIATAAHVFVEGAAGRLARHGFLGFIDDTRNAMIRASGILTLALTLKRNETLNIDASNISRIKYINSSDEPRYRGQPS